LKEYEAKILAVDQFDKVGDGHAWKENGASTSGLSIRNGFEPV